MTADSELSCTAKLVRVVLAERGPLAPKEVAAEARLSEAEVEEGLAELVRAGVAEAVCGVAETGEEVFALTEITPEP
jgi:predicted ArsR family transcriptional regulator